MKAAAWARESPSEQRLLVIDPRAARFEDARLDDLPRLLRAGDLVVVNDAATLPASFQATTRSGDALELRLIGVEGDSWLAIAFGAGDFRTPTEERAPPPPLAAGDLLEIGRDLRAQVSERETPGWLKIRFDCAGPVLWQRLYAHGRPIQYAHVRAPYALWHVQTGFASRPWAFEMPSAGRPLSWGLLERLVRGGVELARVTHAAGISSTGSETLDRRLPLSERSDVPAETDEAIERTRERGGRVIAVGTTVVRALESGRTGVHDATLLIGPGFRPRRSDAVLTGMHRPGTSHFALLQAFAPRALLESAHAHADRAGYLEHELGDSCIVLPAATCRSS